MTRELKSSKDMIRVKEEPKDSWSDEGDDSVDFYQVKNLETFPHVKRSGSYINEAIVLNEKSDDSVTIEFECKDVKTEPSSVLKTICQSDCKSCLPFVKMENRKQTNQLNERNLMILIKKDFDCSKNCSFQENSLLKLDKIDEMKILEKRTQIELSYNFNACEKTHNKEASLKRYFSKDHSKCRPIECHICHKLCDWDTFKRHIMTVHNYSKPYECEICHKSFSRKETLKRHTKIVHNRSKPFDCDICHKSFGLKHHLERHIDASDLNKHINAIHNRSKPFECETCHKSFGRKQNLKTHIDTVHNRSKPFEFSTPCVVYSEAHHRRRS
uniref:C2H2-type domain-containing protein n=1 Tax=Trichogramma kaykai TaxID=54128 RepID=A0ABD2XIT2_9HYME